MLRQAVIASLILVFTVSCSKAPSPAAAGDSASLILVPADLVAIKSNTLASGPVITGSIQPARRADLRAEVSAVVLQVLKENGEAVKRGDLLVRLDDTAIRDGATSAEESERAALQASSQAARQFERLTTLRASGMASAQQLEDAEIRRNSAQSELAAARVRLAQARQQVSRTLVRAPFDGIISERKVSAGDTAAIGKELLKVIDPASMRFEGLVSADRIASVKLGQAVRFRINGYGQQEFSGTVKRIDPAANPTTRQVEVLVEFAAGAMPGVSGLYAEGQIEAGSSTALMIPESALVREGDGAWAWRIKDGALEKAALTLGERDARRGQYVVRQGLAEGDLVLRNPQPSLKAGRKVDQAAEKSAATGNGGK